MKPNEIIRKRYDLAALMSHDQWVTVLQREKRRMEGIVEKLGLTLTLAGDQNIQNIHERTLESFTKEAAEGISLYDVYRFVRHGYPVVALDRDQNVLAYDLSISYDDPEKTSYEVAVAVDQRLSGHGLGALLSVYGAILGWERGSRVRESTVHPLNAPSVKNLLNHVGFHGAAFVSNFLNTNGPRLVLKMTLSPRALMNRGVSMDALRKFVETRVDGNDYRLIPCGSFDDMDRMYRETRFRIAAFVPGGILDAAPLFLALKDDTEG